MTTTPETEKRAIWWKSANGEREWNHYLDCDDDLEAKNEAEEGLININPAYYKMGETVLILPLGPHPNVALAANAS